ncbi:MAG TPA: hypothetical protein VFZ88_00820 [Sphingomicrobium sp.]
MFNAVALASIFAALFVVDDSFAKVAIIAVANIVFIVLGERPRIEENWDDKALPGREAVGPTLSVAALVATSAMPSSIVATAIVDKMPILALILAFAVVSNGLSRCGFFQFAAYKAVEKCGGTRTG